MEWQHLGNNDWVYGEMVRGLIRNYQAEIYYDEEKGWVWLVHSVPVQRGTAGSLQRAVEASEKAMGVA